VPSCLVDPSFVSIECRLAEIPPQIVVGPDYESFGDKLEELIAKADGLVEQAHLNDAEGRTGKAKRNLSGANTRLKRFVRQVGSKKGQKAIDEMLREELMDEAETIRTDVQLLRESL